MKLFLRNLVLSCISLGLLTQVNAQDSSGQLPKGAVLVVKISSPEDLVKASLLSLQSGVPVLSVPGDLSFMSSLSGGELVSNIHMKTLMNIIKQPV